MLGKDNIPICQNPVKECFFLSRAQSYAVFDMEPIEKLYSIVCSALNNIY